MTSIFPDTSAGGLIVWDHTTEQPVDQPNVENVLIPEDWDSTCDVTALPDDCRARVQPNQINAIVSELINLFVSMSSDREWDCERLDNLALAFEEFVASLAGGGGGTLTCSVPIGNAGAVGNAYLVYCDGAAVRRWTIQGEDGLVDFILDTMCAVDQLPANTFDDYLLFCRNGELAKTSAINFNLYVGEWLQARAYTTNNLVRRLGRLWSPNANIPNGTAFVVGTTGQTWYEVSPSVFPPLDPATNYSVDTIINYMGKFYAANADIPAGTPFVVGTTGQTWRELDLSMTTIPDFQTTRPYKKWNVVVSNGLLFRARNDISPGPFVASQWEQIGGERNLFRGDWLQANSYNAGDMVRYGGRLYTANTNIAPGTPFTIGVGANMWVETSPSIGLPYNPAQTYTQDQFVSDAGRLWVANGNIPINTPPATNQGTIGATWREFSADFRLRDFQSARTYAPDEIVARTSEIPGQKAIWRFITDKAAGDWSDIAAEIIGERNKMRGDWYLAGTYKQGDIVLNPARTEPYGTLFRANSNIASGTAFVVGGAANQWTALTITNIPGSGITLLPYNQANAYTAGQYVATPWGIYYVDGNVAAGEPFRDVTGSFTSMNRGRPKKEITANSYSASRDDRGRCLIFTFAGPKNYGLSDALREDGDTIMGYSTNGPLTITGAPNVEILTPEGQTLRDRDYASFVIRSLGLNSTTMRYEFLLSGDLEPLP